MREPRKAPPSPRRRLGGFIHLLARFYQDYRAAIIKASKRHHGRAVDVDVQLSKDGTMWALHWATVGKNKLHDQHGKIEPWRRIRSLTDEEISRLRGPKGQRPHKVQHLVNLASRLGVRLELETKTLVPTRTIEALLKTDGGRKLNQRNLLQFKARAALKHSIEMMSHAHVAGGTTILSWERYHGKGIYKDPAWVVVDYSRGRSHWI